MKTPQQIEASFKWATEQRARLCPTQNKFALETIDACVAAFEKGGRGAAASEFKQRIRSRNQTIPLWAAAALKDIVLGLLRIYP
jgi:hypothetical protein